MSRIRSLSFRLMPRAICGTVAQLLVCQGKALRIGRGTEDRAAQPDRGQRAGCGGGRFRRPVRSSKNSSPGHSQIPECQAADWSRLRRVVSVRCHDEFSFTGLSGNPHGCRSVVHRNHSSLEWKGMLRVVAESNLSPFAPRKQAPLRGAKGDYTTLIDLPILTRGTVSLRTANERAPL